MKIATCTVSLEGYEDPGWNNTRLAVLSDVFVASRALQVDLLCLPAGYLTVDSTLEIERISKTIREEAKKHRIAVAVGIDAKNSGLFQKGKEPNAHSSLPYFAVCWTPNQDVLHIWQQRSASSTDQWNCSDPLCAQVRALPVLNRSVEVLLCGEIFNERIRNNVLSREEELSAVVDLGHTSAGFRVWAGMKKLAEGGLTSLCSVHANSSSAQKYCYTPQGAMSDRTPDRILPGPPRVELKVWHLS